MRKKVLSLFVIGLSITTNFVSAQVGIGTEDPDKSTMLDIVSTDKGILVPRVTLTSIDMDLDQDDSTSQPAGLLVYNTGGSLPEGYMFWNGQEWRLMQNSTTVEPNAVLSCGEASLDPEQLITDVSPIITGSVIRLPYTLGNGGMFKGVVLESVGNPNVKATLPSGQFENGSGYLPFYVSGQPTASQVTPAGLEFDLTPFYQANPSVEVGCTTIKVGQEVKSDITSVALMDNLKYVESDNSKGYAAQLTTPDGKFTVRTYIVSRDHDRSSQQFGQNNVYGMNLQIRNNTSTDVVIAGQFTWTWGITGGSGVNKLGLQPGKWSGDNAGDFGTLSDNKIYWASTLNGTVTNTATAGASSTSKNATARFITWGNEGIYADGRPERRTYSWTINDGAASKTAYILTFSSSALYPNTYADNENCPNGVCSGTKVFMKIDQITAP